MGGGPEKDDKSSTFWTIKECFFAHFNYENCTLCENFQDFVVEFPINSSFFQYYSSHVIYFLMMFCVFD